MRLPIVHRLGGDFSMQQAFNALHSLSGCLWFDSAARGPELEPGGDHAGRYSFICADPVDKIVAYVGDENPWPRLKRWCDAMPKSKLADLPPFQGGVAGLWGYEAGTWLEPVGRSPVDDLPTPAISVGLYDWVVCHDRMQSQAWLISWGFASDQFEADMQRASARAAEILERLSLNDRRSLGDANSNLIHPDSMSPPPVDRPALDRPALDQLAPAYETHWPNVWSNFSSDQYRAAISNIIESIRNGDSFQVNLAQRLLTRAQGPSAQLMQKLRLTNAAPFAGYYDGDSFQVISSSPEGFLRLRDGIVQTRPIKGTVARTGDDVVDRKLATELLQSEKDRAENVMIVDLMRNDLSRVCEDDSVRVNQLCGIERYAHVQHLVSVVEGRLRRNVGAIDLLAACFPGGSITGAPKIEAMRMISASEPTRRGPYCGSLGYISTSGDAEFSILIRTITSTRGWWQIPVGGGITLGSDPKLEEHETWVKAEGMLRAIAQATSAIRVAD